MESKKIKQASELKKINRLIKLVVAIRDTEWVRGKTEKGINRY